MAIHLTVSSKVDPIWKAHKSQWKECVACEIGRMAQHHVFTRGALPCDVLFLGEAPGDTEDSIGIPFVGRAGKTLDKFICELSGRWFKSLPEDRRFALLFQRGGINGEAIRWAITNTVLCRPADSRADRFREPTAGEKYNCRGRLDDFIGYIARPKAIVCLGKHAVHAGPFDDENGKDIPCVYVKHPSAINRMGGPDSERGKVEFESSIVTALGFLKPLLK